MQSERWYPRTFQNRPEREGQEQKTEKQSTEFYLLE